MLIKKINELNPMSIFLMLSTGDQAQQKALEKQQQTRTCAFPPHPLWSPRRAFHRLTSTFPKGPGNTGEGAPAKKWLWETAREAALTMWQQVTPALTHTHRERNNQSEGVESSLQKAFCTGTPKKSWVLLHDVFNVTAQHNLRLGEEPPAGGASKVKLFL